MNRIDKQGFTMVELVVVITILAILTTIGYISFGGYLSSARDSTRLHNITIIQRAVEYHREKQTKLFQPENAIPITLSGVVVGYQGDMGKTILGHIGITEGGTDPSDGEYYSYFVSGNNAQILALFENPKDSLVSAISDKTYAAVDYSDRYPFFKGSALGMILEADNTPIHRSADVIAEGEFDIFNPTFSIKQVKSLYSNDTITTMPALMIGGQLSLNSKNRTTDECPENFIPVPGNVELGQPDFCIGKYEASTPGNISTSTYQTIPGVLPYVDIPGSDALRAVDCRGNGENYHIMTMMEWLTIARNIENNSLNWSNGKVGSGYIIGGNNGNNTTGFDSGGLVITGPTGNTSQDNKRQLILSNGETIWDFVGNAWEIVKTLNLYTLDRSGPNEMITMIKTNDNVYRTGMELFPITGMPSTSIFYGWDQITDENFKSMFGPHVTDQKIQGIGAVRQTLNKFLTLVGGDHSDGSGYENGLYSIIRTSSITGNNVGTRCAYSY